MKGKDMKRVNDRKSRRWIAVAGAAGILLGGCVFQPVADPTRFYLLDGVDYEPVSEAQPDEAAVVGLARVRVASYLDSPGITIREDGSRIAYSQLNRWAESLEDGVSRMLTEKLRQEPVVSHVVGYPVQRSPAPDYDLQVSVLRAEGVISAEGTSHGAFVATWEVRIGSDGALLANGQVRAEELEWDGQDFDGLSRSLSVGVNELAQQVARAVQDLQRSG